MSGTSTETDNSLSVAGVWEGTLTLSDAELGESEQWASVGAPGSVSGPGFLSRKL